MSMHRKWPVIFEGELFMAVVFEKTAAYREPVQYPMQGTIGCVVHKHIEIEVQFNEARQVWHGVGQGADIERYRKELDKEMTTYSWSY